MSNLPVFVDGPLKGRADFPVDALTCINGLTWQPAPREAVHYWFTDVPMFGHTVLVGSIAQPPDGEALFEALCSDQAKASARWQG